LLTRIVGTQDDAPNGDQHFADVFRNLLQDGTRNYSI